MKFLKQYRIPFTGLKNTQHEFDFEIDKRFFDEFDYSIVKDGSLNAIVKLDKQETMIVLNFEIEGSIWLNCNVCLNNYPEKVKINERVIVKFDNEEETADQDTEEIIILSRNDYELDIVPLLYEYINLAVPVISRCDNPGNEVYCDKEMVSKIKSLSSEAASEDIQDPRWEALKKIKINKK